MNQPAQEVVTRFAPSPTGSLHVGGARTALFNWAYARRWGGQFLLRIEDTDQTRSTVEAEQSIIDDLAWLGINWDQTPVRQSERLIVYQQYVEKLLANGMAYQQDGAVRFRVPPHDVIVQDEILGRVVVPAGEIEDFVIQKSDGFPTYHLAVVIDDALMGVTHVIRGQEHLNNAPKHRLLQEALEVPQPVYAHIPLIFNADGSKMSKRDKAKQARASAKQAIDGGVPTATFADAISGLLVEQGWEDGAARQRLEQFLDKTCDDLAIAVAIAQELNISLPEIDVSDFRQSGYLPQALCNYLSLLGWNPGNDLEKFDQTFLAEQFDFERVGKSNSRFDRVKLASFNGDAIREMPLKTLTQLSGDYAAVYQKNDWQYAQSCDPATAELMAAAFHERSQTLGQLWEQAMVFVAEDQPRHYDVKAAKKGLLKNEGQGLVRLKELRDQLAAIENWSGQAAHETIKSLAETHEVSMGQWAQPLRVAISGTLSTPPVDLVLSLLGREATLLRIDRCLTHFASDLA